MYSKSQPSSIKKPSVGVHLIDYTILVLKNQTKLHVENLFSNSF